MTDPTQTERLTTALDGRYRVEKRLGEGGMATVYLAEDLKHERKVALKILKPELAAVIGGERFLAEIKTTAALQHPHILTLYDSGEADGFLYYVMPYIEGESLRGRIDREKQLGVEEAVRITREVADALAYAHEQGVIHRDIKPENILLRDGRPVVADFGIALAISAAGGGRMTETGLSLGTPHYMSPEQATADRDLTARSDQYSLGCVLYEMLTGDPPHVGPTAQSILMRILTEAPRPVTEVRASVPPNVASAVARALEKLPADRFESAKAFAGALEDRGFSYEVRTTSAGPATRAAEAPGPPSSWLADFRSKVAIGAMAILAGGGFGLGALANRADAPGPTLPVIRMPFDTALGLDEAQVMEFSPDGSMLAYLKAGNSAVFVVELDGPVERALPGTENAGGLAFSPDGAELAYTMEDGIYRMAVEGGPPILVLEKPIAIVSHWDADGSLYFASLDAMWRLPPDGEPEQLMPTPYTLARQARPIPGGRWMMYTQRSLGADDAEGEIRLLDLETLESKTLVEGGFDARFAPTGHVLYARADQTVLAVPFDAVSGEVTGRPFTVLDSVAVNNFAGMAVYALSPSGSLFYVRGPDRIGGPSDDRRLVSVSPSGELEVLPVPAASFTNPVVSPDGRHLVFSRDQTGLVVYESLTGRETVLTVGIVVNPRWSRDGESLSFSTFGGGEALVATSVWRWREGPVRRPVAVDSLAFFLPLDWTPDGRMIGAGSREALVFGSEGNADIFVVDQEGNATAYLDATWQEQNPAVSPDGTWVAYQSDESGTDEVYVRSFPDPGVRHDISAGPGRTPQWSADGRAIYFSRGDSVWVAELESESDPTVRARRPVFGREHSEGRVSFGSLYPDGRIVGVLDPASTEEGEDEEEPEQPSVAYIVANWFTELLERQGGGR